MLGKTATATTSASGKVFPGQYFDQETGLHLNGERYYDPETGRYLTSEPIGVLGLIEARRMLNKFGILNTSLSLNTYSYAFNSPLNYFDPDGLIGRNTIEAKVYNTVLKGDKQQLDFLLKNVVGGEFSPAKKLLLRKQCARNADKIKTGTLDVSNAERQLVDALRRGEQAAKGQPQPRTAAEKFVEAIRFILRQF